MLSLGLLIRHSWVPLGTLSKIPQIMGFPRPIGGNRQCNWLCVSTRHCSSNPSGLFFPTLVVNLHERQYLAEYLMEILCRSPGLFPRQLSVFFGILSYWLSLPWFPLDSELCLINSESPPGSITVFFKNCFRVHRKKKMLLE